MFSVSDAQAITDRSLREQIEKHPRAQHLLRAFLYPYTAPDHDFLFVDGAVMALPGDSIKDAITGRIPVLAVGSNRAPVQLARKFATPRHLDPVPVTVGWMDHHDIVYSAQMTGYGAIPATLAPSPGTRVRVAVTWLNAVQLTHMHATESVPDHYQYQQIDGKNLHLDCGVPVDLIGSYQSTAGHVFDANDIFALAGIAATKRRFKSMNQWEMIAHIAMRAGHPMHPDFVLWLTDNIVMRKKLVRRYLKSAD